jgi:DNA invertase Pin-like site-specific DNA recombinase
VTPLRTDSLPVALYARFSTDRQDARSLDDQARRCRRFAEERGYEVVADYRDAAESGAHLDRADMQRMLSEARKGKRCLFRAVLVDDLSRLSRDLGNTWRIVFEDLAFAGVKVIDCTTGMASDGAGARLTFGAMALVNDTFLQLVKTETHRGLEGRALAGFWTGGRVYGYSTVQEEKPPDPEHPRKVPVINEAEAKVVRRIFSMYADGASLASIASTLNGGGILAPYDGKKYAKRAGKGWSINTLHSMVRNERYIGKFTWNKRKWGRLPNARGRRSRMRPPEEWLTREFPHLAIIPNELWARVQARIAARRPGVGGPRQRKFTYLLSGLLRCGACGSSMSIVSRRKKGAVSYASFGCSANHNKGEHICSNAETVSERKVNEAVLSAVRDLLTSPKFADRFVEVFEKRLRERKTQGRDERTELEDEVREQERRVEKVTEAIAKVGFSESLAVQLRKEDAKLTQARSKLAALFAEEAAPESRPDPAQVRREFEELTRIMDQAPERARGSAHRLLTEIILTPTVEDGEEVYRAVGGVKTNSAAHLGGRVLVRDGCGGRI